MGTSTPSTETAASRRAGRAAPPWGFLAWLVFVPLWLTWTPMIGRSGSTALAPPTSLREILVNLVLLAPVGALLAVALEERVGRARALAVATGTAAALSLLIEGGQWAVASLGRTASPWDVALNAAGAGGSGWAALRARGRGVRRGGVEAAIGGAAVLAVSAYVLVTGAVTAYGFTLWEWDRSYPVLAGSEVGGERPYRGTVREARICAGPGATAEVVCAGPGAPEEVRRALAERAEASQRVTLSAVVVSETEDQEGPARIVGSSAGVSLRNATLAQQGTDLVLRTRTPRQGLNGWLVTPVLRDAVPVGVPTRVSGSFDRGRFRLAAGPLGEGGETSRATFAMDLLPAWWLTRPANEVIEVELATLVGAGALGAVALFVPLGYGGARLPSAGAAGGILGVLAAPVLLHLGDGVLGTGPAAYGYALAAAAAAAGATLGWLDRRMRATGMGRIGRMGRTT